MARRIHQDRDEGLSGDPIEIDLANLRGLIRTYKPGLEELAEQAKLHVSTVVNVAYGITRRPADSTVKAILGALGYRRAIVPKDAKPVEEVRHRPYWPGDILARRAARRSEKRKERRKGK